MAKLAKAVHVRDPDRNRIVQLQPGEEPEPRLAALITNPDCWEDGVLPGTAQSKSEEAEPATDTKPAAKPAAKKTAARKPAAN